MNIADGMMGMNLCLFLIVNLIHKNNFVHTVLGWKQHWLCITIGSFHFISTEASLFFLVFMFLKRVYRLQQIIHHSPHEREVVAYTPLWLICLGLNISIAYLCIKPAANLEMGNNLCLLLDPTKGVQYEWHEMSAMCCVVAVNALCLMVLMACYIFLGKIVWKASFGHTAKLSTKKPSLAGLVKVAILTFGTVSTYIPTLILHIITMLGYNTEQRLATWIVIITTPIASIINPIVNLSLFHSKKSVFKGLQLGNKKKTCQ
jgi:hypothetical protein